jgi:putative membrane protein
MTFRVSRLWIAAAGSVVLALSNVTAQTTGSASPASAAAPSAKISAEDMTFLQRAAEGGHAEIESSKLAATKASSDKVKAFAKQMVNDHTMAADELRALAASKGAQIPSVPSSAQVATIKALAAAEGAKFDAMYATEMGVKAHQETVALFERSAKSATDADIRAWANKTLPTLNKHLTHATEMKAAVAPK